MENVQGFIKFLTIIVLAASIGSLCLYNYYVFFMNETNHTSMEVDQLAIYYAALALLYALLLRFMKHWLVVLGVAVGIAGATEILLLDHFGVMSYYDDWARHGLESRVYGCWFLHC